MTYMMGAVGESSIPGAKSLAETNPFTTTVPVDPIGPGGVDVTVETPFPGGNVADFNTRWDLIQDDTLPAYQDLVHNHPQQARDIIATDVRDRIDDNRIYHRLRGLLDQYKNDWDVDTDWHW